MFPPIELEKWLELLIVLEQACPALEGPVLMTPLIGSAAVISLILRAGLDSGVG